MELKKIFILWALAGWVVDYVHSTTKSYYWKIGPLGIAVIVLQGIVTPA